MSTLDGQLNVSPSLNYVSGGTDLGIVTQSLTSLFSWTVANGTGADQMDLIFSDTREIAAGADDDLDLAGGLTDAFGAVLTFARVKFLYVSADADNGGLIQVGGAAANQFINWVANASDILNVPAEGAFAIFAPAATGYVVTAGTGDILRITNSDGGAVANYSIVIGGASA